MASPSLRPPSTPLLAGLYSPPPLPTTGVVHILQHPNFRQTTADWAAAQGHQPIVHESPRAWNGERRGAQPNCVILDFDCDGECGLAIQRRLRNGRLPLTVLFAAVHPTVDGAVAAMKEGAVNVLEIPCNERTFSEAVAEAIARDALLLQRAQRLEYLQGRFDSLSQREWKVMKLVVEGRLNKTIARELQMTERTVERVRAGVLEKVGVDTAVQMAALLTEHQLLCNGFQRDLKANSRETAHTFAAVS